MAEEYIVVGSSEGKLAGHASTIDSLIIAHKDGRAEEREYKPTSETPGQELMQHIDGAYPGAEAVITRELEGPPNYNKRAIINESEEDIAKVIEKYKNGEYDSIIERQTKEAEEAEETPYKTPAQDGSGKGERANKGRNPECPPEEQEEYGRGSGTKEGRAEEGKPKGTAYEIDKKVRDYIKSMISLPHLKSLVEKYHNISTKGEKQELYDSIREYLSSEAAEKGLEGEELEKYIESELEKQVSEESDSSESSEEEESGGSDGGSSGAEDPDGDEETSEESDEESGESGEGSEGKD